MTKGKGFKKNKIPSLTKNNNRNLNNWIIACGQIPNQFLLTITNSHSLNSLFNLLVVKKSNWNPSGFPGIVEHVIVCRRILYD